MPYKSDWLLVWKQNDEELTLLLQIQEPTLIYFNKNIPFTFINPKGWLIYFESAFF